MHLICAPDLPMRPVDREAAVVSQVMPDDPKAPVNVPVSIAACNALTSLACGKVGLSIALAP